jgi:hypothetical protein
LFHRAAHFRWGAIRRFRLMSPFERSIHVAQDWYYVQGDSKHGPVPPKKLQELASSGELKLSDMVWRDGMEEWKEARFVKGLFSDVQRNSLSVPPLLPAGSAIPAPAKVVEITAPALWNPFAVRAWSLLLTPAFGAFLMMKNWKTLGDDASAKRSMIWSWGSLGFIFLALVTPNSVGVTTAFRTGACILFVVWAISEAEKQVRYVKETYGEDYARKPWGKPLGIAAACIFLVLGLIGLLGESADVSLVKNGQLDGIPEVTVGQLVDNFLGGSRWSTDKGPGGQRIVNVKGQMTFMGKPVQAAVQFIVQGKRFELHAFEMNGIPQNNLVKATLFNKMYEHYKSLHPIKNDLSVKAIGESQSPKPKYDINDGLPPAFELLMSGKPPEAISEALGAPDIQYRESTPSRESCSYLAAWRKSNGGFLMVVYVVRLHPVRMRLELANVSSNRGWNNMTLEQAQAHRRLIN